MERLALRWIYGKTVSRTLSPEIESAFDTIEADLKKYRTDTFGDPSEAPVLSSECVDIPDKFYCLGKWTDLMPTDGTHIEIIQSHTSGADDFSTGEIQDASDLRKAVLDSRKQDSKIKSKAVDQMTDATQTKVKIQTDGQQQSS